jgi:hypothetical protein
MKLAKQNFGFEGHLGSAVEGPATDGLVVRPSPADNNRHRCGDVRDGARPVAEARGFEGVRNGVQSDLRITVSGCRGMSVHPA